MSTSESFFIRYFGHHLTREKGYRTVFDIDLDALEEKSWQRPGVDVTDYFNFGFNENSWKQYCQQLVCLSTPLSMYVFCCGFTIL